MTDWLTYTIALLVVFFVALAAFPSIIDWIEGRDR